MRGETGDGSAEECRERRRVCAEGEREELNAAERHRGDAHAGRRPWTTVHASTTHKETTYLEPTRDATLASSEE